jgi:hypothetical protein
MADIALGAVPLVIKIAAECLNGYRLFTEAKELGHSSQKLLWKFKIQEARLRIWAREFTVAADDHDEPDKHMATETLHRISNVFKDYYPLKVKYGLSLVSETASPTSNILVCSMF